MIYECVLASSAQTTSLPQLQAVSGSMRQWEITLRESPDVDSAPVDLTEVTSVEFISIVKGCTTQAVIRQTCVIVDPYEGRISLSLGPEELQAAGLWKGVIQTKNADGYVLDEYPCRLLVSRSILDASGIEIPTVGDVRSFRRTAAQPITGCFCQHNLLTIRFLTRCSSQWMTGTELRQMSCLSVPSTFLGAIRGFLQRLPSCCGRRPSSRYGTTQRTKVARSRLMTVIKGVTSVHWPTTSAKNGVTGCWPRNAK